MERLIHLPSVQWAPLPLVPALRWAVAVAAGLSAASFLAISPLRLSYPFELEWMEGMMLDHARWVLNGHPLYLPPSLRFVPSIYQPAYVYASAWLMGLLGEGFAAPRAISLAASLGTTLLVVLLVYCETRSRYWAFLAGSLYLAGFRLSGAWYDLARVDALFVFFLVLAVFLARMVPGMGGALAASAALALGFFTKQQAIVPVAALALYYLLRDRRQFAGFVLLWAGLVGGGTLLLNWWSDGWYGFYAYGLAGLRSLNRRMALDFWRVDVARNLSVAAILGLYYLAAGRARAAAPGPGRLYACATLGLVGAGWLARVTQSWDNALMPVAAGAALLLGLGGHAVETRLQEGRRPLVPTLALLAAVGLQFMALSYDPTREVPGPADYEAGQRFAGLLRAMPGDVWVAWHSAQPALAGKTTFAHNIPLGELLASGLSHRGAQPAALLWEELRTALRERRFAAIILDADGVPYFDADLRAHYRRDRPVFETEAGLWPLTGFRSRPAWIFVPQ